MSFRRYVLWGVTFILAGLLVIALAGCGGSSSGSSSSQAAVSAQQVASSGSSSSSSSSSSEPASGDLAKIIEQLEGVKAEDVELTSGTINMELKDFEFVPAILKVKAGTVTFLFDNTATHAHNYRITTWDNHENIIFKGPKIGARRQREMDIELQPGVYYVLCNLSDHESRGMVGKLFVEP